MEPAGNEASIEIRSKDENELKFLLEEAWTNITQVKQESDLSKCPTAIEYGEYEHLGPRSKRHFFEKQETVEMLCKVLASSPRLQTFGLCIKSGVINYIDKTEVAREQFKEITQALAESELCKNIVLCIIGMFMRKY